MEGVDVCMSGLIFCEVVQDVLLYGPETWEGLGVYIHSQRI